jgi:uncharacterized protein YeaO (DUF488 family)
VIETRRVYGDSSGGSGYRVLVDRLWPRGLKKEDVKADTWLKEVAPSTELRKWFGHEPEKWPEFKRRYFKELKDHPDEVHKIVSRAKRGRVVLLYGAKDEEHNEAVALKEYIEKEIK